MGGSLRSRRVSCHRSGGALHRRGGGTHRRDGGHARQIWRVTASACVSCAAAVEVANSAVLTTAATVESTAGSVAPQSRRT